VVGQRCARPFPFMCRHVGRLAPSLRAFMKQRAELLALLRPLPTKGWSRSATVTGAGTPRDRTVLEYARRLADHERIHVKQIARLVT